MYHVGFALLRSCAPAARTRLFTADLGKTETLQLCKIFCFVVTIFSVAPVSQMFSSEL